MHSVFVFCFFLDPQHSRSQSNLLHYEHLFREELSKNGDELREFKNERLPSPYPEREIYESLCRGEAAYVIFRLIGNLIII